MPHTAPPLRIGFNNSTGGYASHTEFCREKWEPVEVEVETACAVCFDKRGKEFFVNKTYAGPQSTSWLPKIGKDGTAGFDVYKSSCPPSTSRVLSTHSIKIGSGRRRRRRIAKAKGKRAGSKSKKKKK